MDIKKFIEKVKLEQSDLTKSNMEWFKENIGCNSIEEVVDYILNDIVKRPQYWTVPNQMDSNNPITITSIETDTIEGDTKVLPLACMSFKVLNEILGELRYGGFKVDYYKNRINIYGKAWYKG